MNKRVITTAGVSYLIVTSLMFRTMHMRNDMLKTKLDEGTSNIVAMQEDKDNLINSIQTKDAQLAVMQEVAEKYYKQQEETRKLDSIILEANPTLDSDTVNAIATAINKYSMEYNVPKEEILAVIKTESNFTPDLVSSNKDRGLMQIIPATEKEIVKDLSLTDYDIFSVDTNIEMGTYYISKLKNKYGKYAYIVYNQGLTKPLNQHTYDTLMASNSTSYIHKVLTLSEKYKEEM